MAYKYIKKVSSTTPYTGAMGQYNYDDSGNKIGVSGNRQLFSLSSNSDVNEENILNYAFRDLDIYVKINYLYFESTKSDDSGFHEFYVYLLDDANSMIKSYVSENHHTNGNDYLSGAYSGIKNMLSEDNAIFGTYDGKPWDYYKCNNGWEASKTNNGCGNANLVGWDSTVAASGCKKKNDWYKEWGSVYRHFNTTKPSECPSSDDLCLDMNDDDSPSGCSWRMKNFPNLNGTNPYDEDFQNSLEIQDKENQAKSLLDEGDAFYLVVYMKGYDVEWSDSTRDKGITVYRIPKKDIIPLITNPEFHEIYAEEEICNEDIDDNCTDGEAIQNVKVKIKYSGTGDSGVGTNDINYPHPGDVLSNDGEKTRDFKPSGMEIEFKVRKLDFMERGWSEISPVFSPWKLDYTNELDYSFLTNTRTYYTCEGNTEFNSECNSDNSSETSGAGGVCGESGTCLMTSENDFIDENDVFDFRPISFISVAERFEYDLQSYYTDGEDYINTTAPNQVNLTFRISQPQNYTGSPTYLDGFGTGEIDDVTDFDQIDLSSFGDIKFGFFVTDWDSNKTEFDWEEDLKDFPSNMQEYVTLSQDGLYQFQDLFVTDDDGNITYNSLTHQYNEAGSFIIKAVLFSYIEIDYEEKTYAYPLRWKGESIKLFMGVDNAQIEDFSELGGHDYTYIPWPETTLILNGFSPESKYSNSVREIVAADLFEENEMIDEGMSKLALSNLPSGECPSGWCPDLDLDNGIRELGQWDSNGEYDVAQFRFFKAPYTIEELLMTTEQTEYQDIWYNNFFSDEYEYTGEYIKYNDEGMWYDGDFNENNFIENNMPKYPINYENIKYIEVNNNEVNSCVGLLFIDKDPMVDRKLNCIIEYNGGDQTGATLHDGSGNDNRGILTGDYKVSKADYGARVTRDDPAKIAKVKTDKLAF